MKLGRRFIRYCQILGLVAIFATTSGCPFNALPTDPVTNLVGPAPAVGTSGGGSGGSSVSASILGTNTDTTSLDGIGNSLLSSNEVHSVFAYDRTSDSSVANQLANGVDPNWYNGITRMKGSYSFTGGNGDTYAITTGITDMNAVNTLTKFTSEFWFNFRSDPAAIYYFPYYQNAAGTLRWGAWLTTTRFPVCRVALSDGSTLTATGTTALTRHTWYHMACVYDQSNLYIYINGQLAAAGVAGTLPPVAGTGGTLALTSASSPLNGDLSEFRLSNSARYTPALYPAGFTPSKRASSDANTVLLFHGDEGPGSSTIYNSAVDTANAEQGGYFTDGTGGANALSVAHNASLIPTLPLTLEAWVWVSQYPPSLSYLFYKSGSYAVRLNSGGSISINYWGGAATATSGASVIPRNQWVHVAISYDGTFSRLFINGILANTVNSGPNTWSGVSGLNFGLGGTVPLYMDEIRVTHDAVYTTSFTPMRRLTALPNTRVMLHLDETSGTVAADSSGNGNDATITATTDASAGIYPMSRVTSGNVPPTRALYNSAAAARFRVPDSALLNTPAGTPITAEAWVYKTNNANTGVVIHRDLTFRIQSHAGGSYSFQVYLAGAWNSCALAAALTANEWHHIAGTYDPATSTAKIFANGTLSNTCTGGSWGGDVNTPNQDLNLGATQANTGPFEGYIDEVRIAWALVYTANFTPSRTLSPHANDVVRFHFNEAAGATTLQDASANNLDAVAVNSPSITLRALNEIPLSLNQVGTARILPAPFMTTGCENITHTGGVNDDTAIEIWVTRGGLTGKATYQWRKVGGANWSNGFNGANVLTAATSQAIGATGVSVTFAANASWETGDHCVIRSWAIENGATEGGGTNTMRGTENAFPARAMIVGTDTGVDIIDTTTTPHSVWMKFTRSTGNMVHNTAAGTMIKDVKFLDGRLYLALTENLANPVGGGIWRIDFTNDRTDAMHANVESVVIAAANTGTTAPFVLAQRNTGTGSTSNNYIGAFTWRNALGGYGSAEKLAVKNISGRTWVAFVNSFFTAQFIDEYNRTMYQMYGSASSNKYSAVSLAPNPGGTTTDLIYANATDGFVGVLSGLELLTPASALLTGASAYTRQYTVGGTPGIMSGRITDIATTAGTSSTLAGYNTIYVAQDTGVSVIQEGLVSGSSDAFHHVPNTSRWPWGSGNHLTFAAGNNVSVNNNAAFALTSDLTVEAWVKSSTLAVHRDIVSFFDWNTANGYILSISNTNLACFYLGASPYCGTSAISDGQWHHVAASLSGTTLRIYVNGKLERTHTGVAVGALPTADSPALCIGRRASASNACANGAQFLGSIDEIRISNTARYTSYAPGVPSGPFTADTNTVALFHFDEVIGSATTSAANNSSATAYTGNVTGATFAARTMPTYNYSYSSTTGNAVVSVAPSTDGTSLFFGVNNQESGRSAVMRIVSPNTNSPQLAETVHSSSSPPLISDRITSLSCVNSDPDVVVGTTGGYTVLNYGPF